MNLLLNHIKRIHTIIILICGIIIFTVIDFGDSYADELKKEVDLIEDLVNNWELDNIYFRTFCFL